MSHWEYKRKTSENNQRTCCADDNNVRINEFAIRRDRERVNKQASEREKWKKKKKTVEFHNKNGANASEKTALRLYIRRVYILRHANTTPDSCLFYTCASGFGRAVKSLCRKACFATQIHTCTYYGECMNKVYKVPRVHTQYTLNRMYWLNNKCACTGVCVMWYRYMHIQPQKYRNNMNVDNVFGGRLA